MLRYPLGLLGLTAASLLGVSQAFAACPPPPEYANVATLQDGDVLVSFAADQHVYLIEQPVRFYLTFENTGTEPIHIPCPYSPEYQILILPDTCLTPEQPGCDFPTSARLPEGVYWFSPGISLDPGECYIATSTWNEVSSALFPPDPGVYRVLGGLPGTGSWVAFSVPADGVQLMIRVGTTSGVPEPEPATWGRVKALY